MRDVNCIFDEIANSDVSNLRLQDLGAELVEAANNGIEIPGAKHDSNPEALPGERLRFFYAGYYEIVIEQGEDGFVSNIRIGLLSDFERLVVEIVYFKGEQQDLDLIGDKITALLQGNYVMSEPDEAIPTPKGMHYVYYLVKNTLRITKGKERTTVSIEIADPELNYPKRPKLKLIS